MILEQFFFEKFNFFIKGSFSRKSCIINRLLHCIRLAQGITTFLVVAYTDTQEESFWVDGATTNSPIPQGGPPLPPHYTNLANFDQICMKVWKSPMMIKAYTRKWIGIGWLVLFYPSSTPTTPAQTSPNAYLSDFDERLKSSEN